MYLDVDTYKMYLNNARNNCFEVDALIAKSIQLLNRKGYTTDFCCSGHYGKDENLVTPIVDEYDNVLGETEVSVLRTSVYVSFNESIFLLTIPEGWYVDDLYPNVIRAKIEDNSDLRNSDGIDGIKERFRVFKQILKRNAQLYSWARTLPNLEIKNDKNNGIKSTGV